MRAWTLPDADITPVDKLMLGPDGLLNVVPTWKLEELPLTTLQIWCVKRGVYQFPTEELLGWLSEQIAGRKAIEICAGNGAIGRALGIPRTDSYMLAKPRMAAYYRSLGQEPTTPPPDVQEYGANRAVKHFKPDVVIGAWVTQLWQPGDEEGSVAGVDETAIINQAEYIHVGNDGPHGNKRIMGERHECIRAHWLVSRARDQSKNHMRVWGIGLDNENGERKVHEEKRERNAAIRLTVSGGSRTETVLHGPP